MVCPHSAPDPLKIPFMKRISVEAGGHLFGLYGGSPRLRGAVCTLCVENNRKRDEFEAELSEDVKFINKNS